MSKKTGNILQWNKVLSIILVVFIIGALGALGYSVTTPAVEERLTEFYILGLSGEANDYPTQLIVGEEGKVVVGIINKEGMTVTYGVDVIVDGIKISGVEPVTIEHEGKWEGTVGFTPDRVGDGQKVEFLLYKQGQSEVYHRLHLWIDVK